MIPDNAHSLNNDPEAHLWRELRVEATLENLRKVSEFVRDIGRQLRLTDEALFDVDLAVEEGAANIVHHAYGPGHAGDILVRVEAVDEAVCITLTDWGLPFNAEDSVPLDTDAPVEARTEGGMGLHLIHKLMDDVTRKRASAPGGPNVLVLCKRREHRRAP